MTAMNELIARLQKPDVEAQPEPEPTRTRYGVKSAIGLWAGPNQRWVTQVHALPFEFMTTANAYAVLELGLSTTQYSVEAL